MGLLESGQRFARGIQVSGAECSNRPLWMLRQEIGMERTRTVGTRKGWMESLHVAPVRELSATRQRRLWRPTDDWEMGMMTDGCDGRERMSWRSFPASPRGPLHCCELVTRMPHSEGLGKFGSSLECKARPVFLNSPKTRFT